MKDRDINSICVVDAKNIIKNKMSANGTFAPQPFTIKKHKQLLY